MIMWIKGQCPGQRCPYSADPFGAGYEVEFSEGADMRPPKEDASISFAAFLILRS